MGYKILGKYGLLFCCYLNDAASGQAAIWSLIQLLKSTASETGKPDDLSNSQLICNTYFMYSLFEDVIHWKTYEAMLQAPSYQTKLHTFPEYYSVLIWHNYVSNSLLTGGRKECISVWFLKYLLFFLYIINGRRERLELRHLDTWYFERLNLKLFILQIHSSQVYMAT